jgi:protein-S-isoprenylcysteine O-methyltransferase Ste14
MQTEIPSLRAERRIVILIHGSIAGASIAACLQLASRETLSPLLLLAVGCFAVAIPAAITLVTLAQVIFELVKPLVPEEESRERYWPRLSYVLAVVDQISCYLGFLALFWHFSWIVGAIFLLATAIAYLTVWIAEKNLRKTTRIDVAEKAT